MDEITVSENEELLTTGQLEESEDFATANEEVTTKHEVVQTRVVEVDNYSYVAPICAIFAIVAIAIVTVITYFKKSEKNTDKKA